MTTTVVVSRKQREADHSDLLPTAVVVVLSPCSPPLRFSSAAVGTAPHRADQRVHVERVAAAAAETDPNRDPQEVTAVDDDVVRRDPPFRDPRKTVQRDHRDEDRRVRVAKRQNGVVVVVVEVRERRPDRVPA